MYTIAFRIQAKGLREFELWVKAMASMNGLSGKKKRSTNISLGGLGSSKNGNKNDNNDDNDAEEEDWDAIVEQRKSRVAAREKLELEMGSSSNNNGNEEPSNSMSSVGSRSDTSWSRITRRMSKFLFANPSISNTLSPSSSSTTSSMSGESPRMGANGGVLGGGTTKRDSSVGSVQKSPLYTANSVFAHPFYGTDEDKNSSKEMQL